MLRALRYFAIASDVANFAISDGWNLIESEMTNQDLEPLISAPKTRTAINKNKVTP